MSQLELVKSANFGEIQCDIYHGEKEFYMTREQIGTALEYSNPRESIKNIHVRHRDRLDKYSRGYQIDTPASGKQTTTLYTRKGIMEICRWSQQPKADAFMDFVWEVMDSLMSGKTKIIGMTDYQRMMAQTRRENAKIRSANLLVRLADKYDGTYQQVLHAYATKELTGEFLLPLPELPEKTYSAAEIGERLGITGQMVGILTNRHNLKTEQYGGWFHDKAKGHAKEVQCFRYYESILPVLRTLLAESA